MCNSPDTWIWEGVGVKEVRMLHLLAKLSSAGKGDALHLSQVWFPFAEADITGNPSVDQELEM